MLRRDRNSLDAGDFSLAMLESEHDFRCEEVAFFDCGDPDLNDFFQRDAFAHKEELLATTYYFQPKEATEEGAFIPVAFIALLNDSISLGRDERKNEKKSLWKYLRKSMPYPKRNYKSFPAVKIGRLGVKRQYQRKQIGTHLLNTIKKLFLHNNRTGCRFITVDAYNNPPTISFYKRNGFQFLVEEDAEMDARIMYFDLKRHR